MLKTRFYTVVPIVFLLANCATNPVTGESELSLISEEKELAIGAQQYLPARQSQGGDFVIDKDLTAYIAEVGNKLVKVGDRDLPYEFKVLNNSVPNAWAMPGGKISINRGLLIHLNSEAELAAVLGHEIVHAAAKHAVRQISRGMLLQTAVVGTAIAAQGSEYGGLAQLGAGLGAQLLSTKYGRDAERESDHYGMIYMSRAGYNPQGAVDLQRTFVKLSAGKNQDWLSGMFASHPASQERVENNIKLLATLPKGGEKGIERYQKKLAYLKKIQPAYDAYDKGREALSKKELTKAQTLATQALQIEPKEALFYNLTGDISLANKQFSQAKTEYNQALSLDPNFFYAYLQRGQASYELKSYNQAKTDLEKSITLLPTANAYYVLGNIAKREEKLTSAKEHYAKVASNKSEVGIAAYTALLELDLKDNPNTYLKIKLGKTTQGAPAVEVSNPTPKNIGGLQLNLQITDTNKQSFHKRVQLNGFVEAGKKKVFSLDLPPLSKASPHAIKGKISAAQIVK